MSPEAEAFSFFDEDLPLDFKERMCEKFQDTSEDEPENTNDETERDNDGEEGKGNRRPVERGGGGLSPGPGLCEAGRIF